MKISNLFFMAMLCVSSATVYAQTAETFRQPYPLGEKLSRIRILQARYGLLH